MMMTYLALALASGVAAAWFAGERLAAPSRRPVEAPGDMPVEAVSTPSDSGATLKGWVINPAGRAAVVLLHGIRASRFHMIPRARLLAKAGYAVVMFDLQAHGESGGKHITFGFLERKDAIAAVQFARHRFPGKSVGVIGVSLGGASALLAGNELGADALVLEAVFPTIEEAVKDRIELVCGHYMRWLHPALMCQLKPRAGCGAADLRPIENVGTLRAPKLFMGGTRDRHTKIEETRELFRRACEPKELWEVEGARHEDLLAFAPADYERYALGFLGKHLK